MLRTGKFVELQQRQQMRRRPSCCSRCPASESFAGCLGKLKLSAFGSDVLEPRNGLFSGHSPKMPPLRVYMMYVMMRCNTHNADDGEKRKTKTLRER
jgi:hypothetical protein